MTLQQDLLKAKWQKCTYDFCNGEGICEADRDYPCPECYKGIKSQIFENERVKIDYDCEKW